MSKQLASTFRKFLILPQLGYRICDEHPHSVGLMYSFMAFFVFKESKFKLIFGKDTINAVYSRNTEYKFIFQPYLKRFCGFYAVFKKLDNYEFSPLADEIINLVGFDKSLLDKLTFYERAKSIIDFKVSKYQHRIFDPKLEEKAISLYSSYKPQLP